MIIGVGVDIVSIQRLRGTLDRLGSRFLNRVFTLGEQEYCQAHRDSVPHYAARFAAKEALFKALGTGWARGVSWLDAEVRRKDRAAPVLLLHSEAERLSRARGARFIYVSLSHSEDSAVAVVILES